jgi:hypothetical protein
MSGKNPLGSGKEPQSYEGINIIVPVGGWQFVRAKQDPTISNTKFPVGTLWVNTVTQNVWINTQGGGIWKQFETNFAETNTRNTVINTFNTIPVMSASTGGTAAVTINTTNVWAIPEFGGYLEEYNTTASTAIAPSMSTVVGNGLNIDTIGGAASKSIEITEGNSPNTKNAFIISATQPAFYVQASFNVNTIADVTDLYIGFRKQQAYQATIPAGYTDYATLGVHGVAGLIESQTQVASGGNVVTSTGITITALVTFTLKVVVNPGGVVQYFVNGVLTNTVAYTFTAALQVIPYIIYSSSAGGHAEVDLVNYSAGLV